MPKLKLQLEAIEVVSFDPAPFPGLDDEMQVITPKCVVTGGIDSCWCSEYYTCDCV